ncbi:MAG: Isocitrate lyase (EC [uncultured Caballeronia sp.]|nr:MAG: Isocitrate lyase (EC [uncultured Caballeronia sp.]
MAGNANVAGEMYPDQSLYPANSMPLVIKRINNTLTRADQIQWSEGKNLRIRAMKGISTSSSRSWPTLKPVSAAC